MPRVPRYQITRAFAHPIAGADGQEERREYFTRDNESQLEELLTAEELQARVDSGHIVDNLAGVEDGADADQLLGTDETPVATETTEEATPRRSRSRRR